MLWPERPDNWRARAEPAQQAFAAVAPAIARFEPVTVGASAAQYAAARALLPPAVRVVELSSDDAWMRDVGPSFVVNARASCAGCTGASTPGEACTATLSAMRLVAQKVLELTDCERYRAPLVNEGGAIHVDGQGTVLVTEQCLLDRRRNPGLGRARSRRC